jgi:Flp pilus assembly protein CpaB
MSTATKKKSIFDGRKMWFLFGGIASAVVAILTFTLMSVVTATENYYILTKDIPARTQITADLLTEVTVSKGATPPNAISIGNLTETTYSLYSLDAGDILSSSNAGDLTSLSEGLPSNFVIASFTASPSVAAGGNVSRGDYIDIMTLINDPATTGSEGYGASYALQHVLVIDATIDLDNYDSTAATSTGGTDSGAATTADTDAIAQRSGIPTLFTVGLTQEDATRLAVATQYDLFIVLSSADSQGGNVNLTPGSTTSTEIWGDSSPDAGLNTDNKFGQGGDVVRPSDEPSAPSEPSTPETTEEPTTEG